MYKIVRKQELNASVTLMEIEAPFVARKAKAGQFIIFRIDEMGERVPLTIAGYDREKGTVTIIFQKVGFSTNALGALKEGDYIHDFVGPLGKPTPVEGKKKVCVVGGGVGCAIALPIAKELHDQIRGMNPWPGCHCAAGGKALKIHESRLAEGHGKPGELIALDPVTVACGEGALRLITVQPEGKPRMAAADWLRGARLQKGECLA